MIDWKFPALNYGTVSGFSNSGIETFKGTPLLSLARETLQNSLDAADINEGRPVEVHFQYCAIDSEQFPGKSKYLTILESCSSRWTEQKYKPANAFFRKAIDILECETIGVLKISDFFTTGLRGSDSANDSEWANLIRTEGASSKAEDKLGSFGIGKHAPFTCSNLRAVFYSTHDQNGIKACQGVSRLATHNDEEGKETQGTGYFGYTERLEPLRGNDEIIPFFKRDKIGTDIYVFGFDQGRSWQRDIIRSVLKNFFIAILEEKLIVIVGKLRIDSTTIPELMEEYFADSRDNATLYYYQSFISPDRVPFLENDFEGLGSIELRALSGQNLPKKIAMVRRNGMLVLEKGNFQTPMKFAGVFRPLGDGINQLLREIENPNHDKWEPGRHENPEYASWILKKMHTWIRECVKSLAPDCSENECDFEGMSQYLPDDIDDENSADDKEGLRSIPTVVELVYREPSQPKQPDQNKLGLEESGEELDEVSSLNDPEGPSSENTSNIETGNSGPSGSGEKGVDSALPDQSSETTVPNRTPVKLKKVRAFCINPSLGQYELIIQPEQSTNAFIQLRIVGEVDESPVPALKPKPET